MSGTRGKTVLVAGDPAGLARDIALQFELEGDDAVVLDLGSQGHDVLADLRARRGTVDALILVLAPCAAVPSPADWTKDLLLDEIERNTWPVVEYTRRIHAVFRKYPRYVLGVSSPGPGRCPTAAESLNEVFARYLSYRLFPAGVAVNMVRVESDNAPPDGEAAARLVFALTSGLMDAVRGQTLVLRGAGAAALPVRAGSETCTANQLGGM